MSTKEYEEFERWRRQKNARKLLKEKTKNAPRRKGNLLGRALDGYFSGDWLRVDTYVKDPEWFDAYLKRTKICK